MWEKLNEEIIKLLTKIQLRLRKKKNERQKKEAYIKKLIDSYHEKSVWVNIATPLTGLLTLLIYLSIGIVSADYRGERIIYIITLIIEGILLAILLWEFICCLGNDGLKKLIRFIVSASKRVIVLGVVIGFGYCCLISFFPKVEYYSAVKEVYGIPTGIESSKLEKEDLSEQARYWEIIDKRQKNHMTLLYRDAYKQADFMQKYSTLYNMSLFQPPIRIEIDYKKSRDKNKYRSYGPDAFDVASENGFREPVKLEYYDDSGKLLLKLEKDGGNSFEIITYSSKNTPELLNSLLLHVPEGKVFESNLISQQIEVIYNSAGLPEMRKLNSHINLYGVSGERYIYNENGQISTLYFLDTDGIPVCNNIGIMTIDFQYDEDGNLQNIRYYSDEEKTEKTEGFCGVFCENFKYENGNLAERRQLGRNGSPCYDMNSVCKYRYVYDHGALTEEYFYGRNNSSVYIEMEQIQCCSVKFAKPANNDENLFSISFDLKTNQNSLVSTKSLQNLQDNINKMALVKKQKRINKEEDESSKEETNNNSIVNSKNSEMYIDMNNNLTNIEFQGNLNFYKDTGLTDDLNENDIKPQYTSVYYKMEEGRIKEISYCDENGDITVNEQGCAVKHFDYYQDNSFWVIKESYLNKDGSECIINEGYAAIETIYEDDKMDQIKSQKYLDENDKPVNNKKTGYAIIKYEYKDLLNTKGDISKSQYFDSVK